VKGETESLIKYKDEYLISIHSPCEGRDVQNNYSLDDLEAFQSTLPVKGETPIGYPGRLEDYIFQSTLPVKGETARDT